MKTLIVVVIVLLFHSCNSVDSNSSAGFSIQTEKPSYTVGNTTFIQTTFTNNLGKEIKIYNSSCGGPYFIIEKYDGKNWSLFEGQPICERLPAEPIKLADGKQIEIAVNISLMTTIVSGLYRMKFQIKESANNVMVEDKYLYSNQFYFVQ